MEQLSQHFLVTGAPVMMGKKKCQCCAVSLWRQCTKFLVSHIYKESPCRDCNWCKDVSQYSPDFTAIPYKILKLQTVMLYIF